MYTKDLTEDFRLRLSKTDMDFLRELSGKRACSVSECVRSLIGDYRRGLKAFELMAQITQSVEEEEVLFNGNTQTDIDNQL